jgi:hypothetical protein
MVWRPKIVAKTMGYFYFNSLCREGGERSLQNLFSKAKDKKPPFFQCEIFVKAASYAFVTCKSSCCFLTTLVYSLFVMLCDVAEVWFTAHHT